MWTSRDHNPDKRQKLPRLQMAETEPPSTALIRLPPAEETAILDRVRSEGLPESPLRCDYTRQEGSGVYESNRGRIRRARIEYSLMLCQWCGNLEGSENNDPYCPAKLRALQEKLKRLSEGPES